MLKLKNAKYTDLNTADGLAKLDQQFLAHLKTQSQTLHEKLLSYRKENTLSAYATSQLIIELAPHLEQFIAELFHIEDEVVAAKLKTLSHDPIFMFKSWYVLRQAKRNLKNVDDFDSFDELQIWLDEQLHEFGLATEEDKELAIAKLGQIYLDHPTEHQKATQKLTHWCVRALTDQKAKTVVKDWVSFRLPKKIDYQHLVEMHAVKNDELGRFEGPSETQRERDGFTLTDERMNDREVLSEIHYCVYCHKNDGDFCSKGFPVKKGEPELGLKTNLLDEVMTGCPLEEKISEMHVVKRAGFTIGALAITMIDNPMCPATGHRICNDCMKACIYQKQEPVNIPQVETGILVDVLKLPWGVEIYHLLTQWNPLRETQYCLQAYNGKNVFIMGMGPAGFTMAHHLLMEGCAVVGADGLKIEPLPDKYINEPIYRFNDIKENLDERILAGFGGVSEYGITVRWDKNFLKLIYITLARRTHFQVFGGVRFGGTIKVEDAWQLGFDHFVVAVGAGLPRELKIPGSMAPGMRQANDFLMALQLTGAAKKNSLANLQLRLPAVVIGGGLTGIDTATEAQAYYLVQIEKMLTRHEKLVNVFGETRIHEQFNEQQLNILNEMLSHAREARAEKQRASEANETPQFKALIRKWGGVSIVYRRQLQESPAYRRNHEEVIKALEEGIFYAEGLEPVAVNRDKYGDVEGLVCRSRVRDEHGNWVLSDEEQTVSARSILVATGARLNVAYEFENQGTFLRQKFQYKTFEEENGTLKEITPGTHAKAKHFGAFTSYDKGDRRVSFIGDTHPTFHGSVVKAIASAKRTYPEIMKALSFPGLSENSVDSAMSFPGLSGESSRGKASTNKKAYTDFRTNIQNLFTCTLVANKPLTPNVSELIVHAPMATRNYLPGHYYRLQNYETYAEKLADTLLQTEAMALTATKVDKDKGEISFLLSQRGASTRLASKWKVGQPIALMGPTGVRTRIDESNQTVMIIGGKQAIANLRALGPAMKEAGNTVVFVACLKEQSQLHIQDEIEACTDVVLWITQTGEPIKSRREQDFSATGDYMQVLQDYADGKLSSNPEGPDINLQQIDRILVIGSSTFIKAFQIAKHASLKPYFTKEPQITASVYGPMQCMLKGVCAQCLQWQIDPATGERTKAVFACSWQDEPMELVDFNNLDERLAQNRVQEILTNLWVDYLLAG